MAKIVNLSAMQQNEEDRLSGLPDDLLHHIFTFLKIEDVVQTSLLSKTWASIWSSFPFLKLSIMYKKHVKFADSLLFHRDGGSSVHSLHVRDCRAQYANNVNTWIIYVLERNVQVLEVQIACNTLFRPPLDFTHRLYTCVSLRVLIFKLLHNPLKLPNHIYLPRLEILCLRSVCFDDDCVNRLIASCPRLQSLTMSCCKFSMDLLSISCPQLETLILKYFDSPVPSLEIFAPRLITLEISHCDPVIHSIRSISDFPLLLNANIGTEFCSRASCNKVLIAVRNAQTFDISSQFLLKFTRMLENELHADTWIPCPFDNLKHIILGMEFATLEVLVIIQLLKVSPNLETLILYTSQVPKDNPTDFTTWSKFKLYRLKEVQIHNFHGLVDEMNLIKFFIWNAENLEKLTVVPHTASMCVEGLSELTNILIEGPQCGILSLHKRNELDASLSITFI